MCSRLAARCGSAQALVERARSTTRDAARSARRAALRCSRCRRSRARGGISATARASRPPHRSPPASRSLRRAGGVPRTSATAVAAACSSVATGWTLPPPAKLRAEEEHHRGLARLAHGGQRALGDGRSRRLGDDDDHPRRRVAREQIESPRAAWCRRSRRRRRGCRCRSHATRPRRAAWMRTVTSCMPVPDAPTTPIAPRRTAFAKPSGTPAMIAVPQSGPMTRRPFFAARRFTACSSASGTLSLKRKTWRPRFSAFIASAAAYGPGTDTCASVAPGAAPGPSRSSAARARLRRRTRLRVAALELGLDRLERAARARPCSPSTRIMRSAGAAPASSGDEQSRLSEDVLVRRRAHEERHAREARSRPDRLRDPHQGHRVLVEVRLRDRGGRHGGVAARRSGKKRSLMG